MYSLSKKILFFLFVCMTANLNGQIKNLESPYYVYPRGGDQHYDLSSDWKLSSKDKPISSLNELNGNSWINVSYPTSMQIAHYKAGVLGNPYAHLNAREYEKLEQKVWYYKRNFNIAKKHENSFYLLNFDGIDYYAKVWLNGILLGTHQGIFGGPNIDVTNNLKFGDSNELVVEVISANYGNPNFEPRVPGKIVKGWSLTGGSATEPFFNLGLWRGVRIEEIPNIHIERPFLFTKKIEDDKAVLRLEMEVFDGVSSLDCKLHPWNQTQLYLSDIKSSAVSPDIADIKGLTVQLELIDHNNVAFTKLFTPKVVKGRCWLEGDFVVDHPKLWYPNGLGKPDYYQAKISLQLNGETLDCINFDFGIRTIEHVRSAGLRLNDRWNNWQYVVNGKKFFLKGVNWMPVDALYDITPDKYDWAVKMAKNMGVQLFRIWGSGLLEDNAFYDACNKYGIMVWQEFCIANFDTPEWPQDVLEAQVCQNIFRLRNQPSLAIWCGGNEFNPYSLGNATSMGIIERNVSIFDPTRMFLRTSPDEGSVHLYPDFDPIWYKSYKSVPYVSETGIHCITNAADIREFVDSKELENLGGMFDKSFVKTHPEFVEHFAEYDPGRVPRMLSRASHIDNMSKPNIEAISEASQIGAGEFYQVMSEGLQSNYPTTVGLMPWVYKRPWPVVAAINLVDGVGQPSATYYFLKRTYEPLHVLLDIKRILWAPGEAFPIAANVLNGVDKPAFNGNIKVSIFDNNFKSMWNDTKSVKVKEGTSVTKVDFGTFNIPSKYREKYFYVIVVLTNDVGRVLSHSEYWPRTIKQMEDKNYYSKYVSEPTEWPTLYAGPWLKPTVAKSKTSIEISNMKVDKFTGNQGTISFQIVNKGKYPAFMTHIDVTGVSRSFFASDNYFWLSPDEIKNIEMTVKVRDKNAANQFNLVVDAWNSNVLTKEINYKQ